MAATGRVLLALAMCAAVACASAFVVDRVEKESWGATPPTRWARGPRADANMPLELTIAVKQTNLAELESTLLAVSDPDSPRYGQHLTRDQIDDLVAPRAEDIAVVLSWLQEHGVDLADVDATGNSGECGLLPPGACWRMWG